MSQSPISRRHLLKILAAAAGTAVLTTVPNKWKTPVVDVGALPAHAQTLSGRGAISGTVAITTGSEAPIKAPVTTSTATITATNTITSASFQTVVNNAVFPLAYVISNVTPGTYNVKCDITGHCLASNSITDFGVVVPPGTANFTFSPCT
jgi:hypothetical protein